MDELNVVTLNSWGIPYISKDVDERMEHIANELTKGHYDIVALQEIWSSRNFEMIVEKVKDALPYAHYYFSGFMGSGCAILSRYPIVDTFFHKFLHNGYFWDVSHGDWYGGKGLCCAIIQHPKQKIYFFNTHLHASYGNSTSFKECRALQIYQITQSINHVTRPGDAVILCGDFNHEPTEVGILALQKLTQLNDSYGISKSKPPTCNTLDPVKNTYNDISEPQCRIDYIFVNGAFNCQSCGLALDEIPGTSLHFSDHTGYTASLSFNDVSNLPYKFDEKETHQSLRMIGDLIKQGERLSAKIVWKNLTLILIFLFMFVLMPIFAGEMFHSLFPSSNTWVGKGVFVMQVIVIVLSVIYFLIVVLVNRNVDIRAFKSVSAEINRKLKTQQNGKKMN